MIALIVILVTAVVCLSVFLVFYFDKKKYTDFVLKNSNCIQQLEQINSAYIFSPAVDFDQSHTYDNAIFYNDISCTDYLIYQLQFIGKKITSQIDKINANKAQYSKYLDEVKNINNFGNFLLPIGKLNEAKLVATEKKLFKKHIIGEPTTHFTLTVKLSCSKINGQVYAHKSQTFSDADILPLIKRLKNRNGNFITDRDIWDAICRVERGKVSNKMRFAIYARDGYKCRKCGVSDKYAQLEIDHIFPIAKGGKTTYENLQTLCHDCNVKKGDNIE